MRPEEGKALAGKDGVELAGRAKGVVCIASLTPL